MMMEKSDVVLVCGNIASATRLGIQENPLREIMYCNMRLAAVVQDSSVYARAKLTVQFLHAKLFRKEQGDIDGNNVHREVEIMQHLGGHPGIVKLEAAYEDSNYFHLVMEFNSGGELLDHMNNFRSEPKSARVIKELMAILRYCHGIGVVHRDIKPENILLTSSGSLKLADFGSAAWFLKGQSLPENIGTAAFLAPEVLSGNYSEKVDVWSAGILLHCLLFGRLPYEEASESKILKVVENENLNFNNEEWESISTPAQDLIRKMLANDASARISA